MELLSSNGGTGEILQYWMASICEFLTGKQVVQSKPTNIGFLRQITIYWPIVIFINKLSWSLRFVLSKNCDKDRIKTFYRWNIDLSVLSGIQRYRCSISAIISADIYSHGRFIGLALYWVFVLFVCVCRCDGWCTGLCLPSTLWWRPSPT